MQLVFTSVNIVAYFETKIFIRARIIIEIEVIEKWIFPHNVQDFYCHVSSKYNPEIGFSFRFGIDGVEGFNHFVVVVCTVQDDGGILFVNFVYDQVLVTNFLPKRHRDTFLVSLE
mgnify:CR=1 FL=1